MSDDPNKIDSIAINEVQLILAEKRTSLAIMRTGIAVLAFLIATSKYYDIPDVLHLIIPLGALNLVLIIFGAYLIVRSIIRMKHYDNFINEIKRKHSVFGKFIE